jgi:hypothetical protein
LRRYCIGIVAESRLSATKRFIKDGIPAFLGSVELWIQAGSGNASAERKQEILDAVSDIHQKLDEVSTLQSLQTSPIAVHIKKLSGHKAGFLPNIGHVDQVPRASMAKLKTNH